MSASIRSIGKSWFRKCRAGFCRGVWLAGTKSLGDITPALLTRMVQFAVLRFNRLRRLLDAVCVRHVQLNGLHVQPFCLKGCGGGLSFRCVSRPQQNRDALLSELPRCLEANAFVCAGDKGRLFPLWLSCFFSCERTILLSALSNVTTLVTFCCLKIPKRKFARNFNPSLRACGGAPGTRRKLSHWRVYVREDVQAAGYPDGYVFVPGMPCTCSVLNSAVRGPARPPASSARTPVPARVRPPRRTKQERAVPFCRCSRPHSAAGRENGNRLPSRIAQ